MQRSPASHIGSPRSRRQMHKIERMLNIPINTSGRHRIKRRRRSLLTTGHSISQIVGTQYLDTDVSPRGMNEMVSTDGEKIAIATYHDDLQLRISQLHTRSESQSASMGRMERISVDVPSRSPYATDA